MFIDTTGIVLREVKYGDNTKILTVLTSSEGKITASAHGAYRKNSRLAAATGLLVFSNMTLTRRGERWTLTEAQTIEQFQGLRDELPLISLGSYFAEVTEAIADEDSLNPELLPLCLNSLYALSEKLKPHELIKPAFELRLMAIAGYEPVLEELDDSSSSCGSGISDSSRKEGTLLLSAGALRAAKYILSCSAKKLFSFILEDKALRELNLAAEEYLLTHLDRSFKTLDYYKKTVKMLDL